MIKFFRKIRQNLLMENKTGKYFKYAIGEIVLVVIGIIIAVSLGEWRQNVNDRNEILTYYNNLAVDLQQDKAQLVELIDVYGKSAKAIRDEIDKLQLDSYNQDSLYKGFSQWNIYASTQKFNPQISIYTEIISSGKLKLFTDRSLKSQLLKLYNNKYPELEYYQKNTAETIRNTTTADFYGIFRWLLAANNDGIETTTIDLKNPLVQLNDDWLKNKQSVGFRLFENQLVTRYSSYSGSIRRIKSTINDIELLESEINKVLKKYKE